ncbi:hypothetical protein B0H11DRAFT_2226914 [Mycena galericulata]|nr:hypothetical protein B0H11DRAFT_2226914 [Mycena galericulata]
MSDADATQVLFELAPWKRKRFRDYELSWIKAAESLTTSNPLVEARPNKSGSRWTIYDKATDKIAIFVHAGIWTWASPPQTGNFVPEGKVAPLGVFEGRINTELNRRCETSYAFNTQHDPSFYTAARSVEDYVTGLEGFNKHKKLRRPWQEGETEYRRRRFIFSSNLVIRKTPYNAKDGQPYVAPYDLHPWIREALMAQKSPYWIPNPDMPTILEYVDGKLNAVKPDTYRYFSNGDIVWFSFALTFEVGTNNWMPEYKPLDFIRVGRLPEPSDSQGEFSVEAEVGAAYQSLTTGNVTLLEDDDEAESSHENKARKRGRDSDGDETMSDSGLSDKSAYSAALAALDGPQKRPKTEALASPSKPPSKSKPPGKGKTKVA